MRAAPQASPRRILCACMCSRLGLLRPPARTLLIALAALALSACGSGSTNSAPPTPAAPLALDRNRIVVAGDLPRPGSLDRAALEALPAIQIERSRDDGPHCYRGATLESVLASFGFAE